MPDDGGTALEEPAASGSDDDAGSGAGRKKRRRRPWYRRGGVWAWFVLATAVGAWVLADVAEDRLYSFDVDPSSAEAVAVCEAAGPLADVAAWGELTVSASADEVRLAALDDLAGVAPGGIAGDVREVRDAEDERQALLADVDLDDPQQRDEADEAVEDLADDHAVALRRVDEYVHAACGWWVLVPVVTLG